MPKNRQIIHPKQSSTTVPPPHSYTVMQFRSIQNEDDDDICPVCESECTCGNNNSQSTPQPTAPLHPSPTTAPTSLPLKIKLPARTYWNFAEKLASLDGWSPKSSKPKQTTADSAIVNGYSSSNINNNYVVVHHPGGPFSVPDHQFGTPGPSNPASTSLSLRDTSPLTPEPELELPPETTPISKKHATRVLPSQSKREASITSKAKSKSIPVVSQKNLSTGARSTKNRDATWTATSIKRRGKRAIRAISDDSAPNLTDEDACVTRLAIDSDGTESVQFPTFISAFSTTSDNDDLTSILTDSFDSDSSIRAEEENLILSEQRDKVKHEIFNNEESWHMEKRKWDHLKNNNNWEIRPRKRSVGPEEGDGDNDSDSDSDVEAEEEEEEGEDDDEADIRHYGHGMVTGWQSDEDDFDAELFFATLTDSSGPGSDADAEDGGCSGDEHSDNSDLSSISMSEAAAAGLLSSFDASCPLVVTEDWDGRLVFANGLKDGQGVLDVQFEVDAAQRHRRIREAMDVDVEDTEGAAERDEDEDEADFISDSGETTDDMLDHRSGITTPQGVPLPPRYPTPPVTSIDPLSTFSPIVGARRSRNTRGALDSPKPADILAGAGKMVWDGTSRDCNSIRSPTVSIIATSPPDTATSSSHSRQMPSMGSFEQVPADPKQKAVIDGTRTTVFSPFSCAKRTQRCRGRGRKRSAPGLDVFPYVSKRPRRSSLPGSTRATFPVDSEEVDPLVQSSPELPFPAASIGLDDVLDASFLDSDDSVEPAANTSGERHFRNLSRWDRVPMSTFRRSRTAHMGDINVRVSRLAPPNDGVSYGSYGSPGGHVLRKSPLGATLWQTNDRKVQSNPGSVTVSPVIFPVRDGYRNITVDQYLDPLQEPFPTGHSKSHKQKRREKKNRNRPTPNPPTSIPTSHGFHPLPIVPALNL